MTWREKVKLLHPDARGGDASRVSEFIALMTQRKKEPRLCACGCGQFLRKDRCNKRYLFYDRFCVLRYRYRHYVAILLAIVGLALTPALKTQRSILLAWDAYPVATATIGIHTTTVHDSTRWTLMTTVPATRTNILLIVDGQERWFALSATVGSKQSLLGEAVRLPGVIGPRKKLSSPRDSE